MKNFKVKTYRIFSEKVPKEQSLRLAFLSDLHGFCYGKDNCRLVQAIENARPDAVLAGGDMMVGEPDTSFEAARALFLSLVERFPVYYAFGNHEGRLMENPEKYGDGIQQFCEELIRQGVRILRNDRALLERKDGIPVWIWGWEGDKRFYKRFCTQPVDSQDIGETLGNPEEEAYHILMAHTPQFGQAYFSWGADLILSGHYHGGIWRFSENRGLAAPNLHLFPAYCCGIFSRDRRYMVVSPGLGEHTIPFRIHDPRELIILEIVHGGGGTWQFR